MTPPRHIKNDISTLSEQEPADKESIEHKDWELARLTLQLERKRTSLRLEKDSKKKHAERLADKLKSSIEALQKSNEHEIKAKECEIMAKEHEIKAKEHIIERLKQERNHYRDMASFHQVAENGDAVIDELNIEIDELKSHINHQNDKIQDLEEIVAVLQARNLELTANEPNTSRITTDQVDKLMRQNQEMHFTNIAKDEKIQRLEADLDESTKKGASINAQNTKLLEENLELHIKVQRLHGQVGATAKPTLKPKTVYQRKPNMTQKSLNTMFYDQETSSAASSPASTQSAPSPLLSTRQTTSIATTSTTASPIVSNRHITSTATTSTTASPAIDKPNEDTNKIPLKRTLSATLSDKTNSRVPVLTRDSKEKGRAVEVKQEQVDVDTSTLLENVPDQTVHTPRDTPTIRKKPKNNTSTTTASTSTTSSVRRIVKPTFAPPTAATSFTTCNTSHRRDRSNMIGGTCTACVNFYGTETITANIDGQQMQLTGQDRIQNNSRHRQHRNQRAKTPPGFWDLDFQTPEDPLP